ncbi:TRAP transporter small permease [Rubrimonas cliftonensis]|uniref:TRAP transporter small permease protein n=1 Tax=Rubrimonas cliftonensis TaxID=89524 RepID=A0A1H3XKW0_9RHOB|nr:TRAP transporter small permease subunit [Rubrimonas cliftonensis]SDZ99890.1 TRAP-type C4-dicarboxylate transport system, small permease component [Rubrimonas cliftonensis]
MRLESLRARLDALSRLAALLGGLALSAAALFTVGAVVAAAFGAPVLGDSEVVELAAGVAVTCFMPVCQLAGGHIAVTAFTDRAPARVRRVLETVAAGLFAVVVLVLVWRMAQGGIDAYSRGRISMFLQAPQWWGYAAVAAPAALWAVCAVFVFVERLLGREPPPEEGMAA